MEKRLTFLILALFLIFVTKAFAKSKEPQREWTFLVFLNGNNNLDNFGYADLNEMERIGSTSDVNIVVQWASYKTKTVKRLLVQRDGDPNQVTSPILEDLTKADMGDYKSLVEFVKWGAAKYPAKHYFVNVWDHGGGWHRNRIRNGSITPQDISWDDVTGNHITTKQLGQALNEISAALGQKIDIYGSDACLMQMPEVAGEFSNSVNVVVGSEETEPAEGWPYDGLLKVWTNNPGMSAQMVAKTLTVEYVKSYSGGTQGTNEVQLSAIDLQYFPAFEGAIANLAKTVTTLGPGAKEQVRLTVKNSFDFAFSDYKDLGDFLTNVEKLNLPDFKNSQITTVKDALSKLVIHNEYSDSYDRTNGLSIWLPNTANNLDTYWKKYSELNFNRDTNWGAALKYLLK